MKNNKNIRELKFDISVRSAKEAVPESGNTMYVPWRKISCTTPTNPPPLASRPPAHNELIVLVYGRIATPPSTYKNITN